MDRTHEFDYQSIEEVQEHFFLKDLPFRKGKYGYGKFLFKSSVMKADPGTIVLFQYDANVVSLAELTYIDKFEIDQIGVDWPDGGYVGNEEYKGAYYFDPHTIKTFEPVNADEMREIWGTPFKDSNGKQRKGFNHFGRAKYYLDPAKYAHFCEVIEKVRSPSL